MDATWDDFVFAEEQHWFGNPIQNMAHSPKRCWLLTEGNLDLLREHCESSGVTETVQKWLECSNTQHEDVHVQSMWVTHSADTGEPVSHQPAAKPRRPSKPRSPHHPCKHSLPPEGQSPASHTMARAACACRHCLAALNACSQARSIALQVSHDLKAVILEGEEAPEVTAGLSEARCSLHVQSDSSCPATPLGEAALPSPASPLLHNPSALVHEVSASSGDTVLAWYTPFSATEDAFPHAPSSPLLHSSTHPHHLGPTSGTAPPRTPCRDAQSACRDSAKQSGMVCLQDLWPDASSPGSPAAVSAKKAARASSHLSKPPLCKLPATEYCPLLQPRSVGYGVCSPLQRSVTAGQPVSVSGDIVAVPEVEARRALDVRMASGLTGASVELASLCLPSVALTAVEEPKEVQACVASQWNAARLRSCPNLPTGLLSDSAALAVHT